MKAKFGGQANVYFGKLLGIGSLFKNVCERSYFGVALWAGFKTSILLMKFLAWSETFDLGKVKSQTFIFSYVSLT